VILANRRFGDVVMSEIGATMVGSIIQTYNGKHQQKGDEKGYFKFGGSSIILLFKKDVVIIDEDLLKNTENGLETQVKMGERIAVLNQ
jgi:phosphatidylserine decarboxylase